MPTPIELLSDPISIFAIGMYLALMIYEALFPARTLLPVPFWRLKGIIAFILFFFLSSYLPMFWDSYLHPFQLLDLTDLGNTWGSVIGLLVYEAGVYCWHRALHSSDFLWRTFHQMHHSAERVDTYGAFWFSPLDMIGFTLIGSLSLVLVIGITPEAAMAVILVTFFLAIFQHANIRTPQWMGYFIQRPESHTVHHGQYVHKMNYGDITLFDILFGTFHNPKFGAEETGFYYGASNRVTDMLMGKDINVSDNNCKFQPARTET